MVGESYILEKKKNIQAKESVAKEEFVKQYGWYIPTLHKKKIRK